MRARSTWLCFLALALFAAPAGLGCGGGVGVTEPDAPPAPDVDAEDADAGEADAPAPILRLDFVDPDHGPFTGGTEVVMRGRGFADGMTVTFGGRAVEPLDVQIVDDRRAVVKTPPGDPGPADVAVAAGDLGASLPAAYTYEAILVEPPSGSVAGGTFVRIRGFGTQFQPGDTVSFEAGALLGTTVVGAQEITGFTPPGVPGAVDVTVNGALGVVRAADAYTYANTTSTEGGLGGGPIAGTVNVTVLDAYTDDGVDGAFVTVDDPFTSPFTGTTDAFGQITFSAPGLVGPITVTAGKATYANASFVVFDARDVTIYIEPKPDPMPGPFPPGRQAGFVQGYIMFGSTTGIGSPNWDLVPAPRTPTEIKRAYVFTSLRSPFSGTIDPGPGGAVDYVGDGRTAWEFGINAWPTALAVVAVAGLYDPAVDPDGDGPLPPGVFEGFAMGAARGVLVGPGENVRDVAIVIDTPLDTAIPIELASPPPLGTPGWWGPTEYSARAYIDLGGEGVIALPDSYMVFPAGVTDVLLPGMAPLAGSIADGSYLLAVGAYSIGETNPFSVRVLRGVTRLAEAVVVDDFLGVPRPFDPPPTGGPGSWPRRLAFYPEAGPTGAATFHEHILATADGTPIWNLFTRGDQVDVPLPDLAVAAGLDPLPTEPIVWTIYSITVPGLSFDQWTYRYTNPNFWSAYAADAYLVTLAPNP